MNQSRETIGSREKRAELREDFDYFDADHDGRMQFGEFIEFLSGIEAGMSRDECRLGFQEIDTDRDGVIEFEEFIQWWASP